MPRLTPALAFLFLASLTGSLHAASEPWTNDMTRAMKQAKQNNTDVLIDFTGSDWCPPCQKMHKQVFSTDAFQQQAPKHFELVKMDFPKKKQLPPEVRQQNQMWQQKLQAHAYPTIVLLDAQGQPYAKKTGYRPKENAPQVFLQWLDTQRQNRQERDRALDQAREAQGLDKARQLDRALSTMDRELIMSSYRDRVRQIVELDPDNQAGLKQKYRQLNQDLKVKQQMQQVVGMLRQEKADPALKRIDQLLDQYQPSGQVKQRLLALKAQIHYALKDDPERAAALLGQAAEADPDSQIAPRMKQAQKKLAREAKQSKQEAGQQ